MAAVVVAVRVVDLEQDARRARHGPRPARAIARDDVLGARRVGDVEEPVLRVAGVEGEAEETALTAEVNEAPDVEEHRPPARGDADDPPALLDDVDRTRISGRIRHQDRRLERASEERLAEGALRSLPRVAPRDRPRSDRQRAREHEDREDTHAATVPVASMSTMHRVTLRAG